MTGQAKGPLVPVIDLAGSADDVASAIGDACERVGFFQIVNHGVSDAIVDGGWAATRTFFEEPDTVRASVQMPHAGYPYGYQSFAIETLSSSLDNATPAPPDRKHTYSFGPIAATVGDEPSDPDEVWVRSPNLWPDSPTGFRVALEAYYVEMGALAARLLGLMARSLSLPASYFTPMIDRHVSALRCLDYPEMREPPASAQMRASAHTDYGTLTILRTAPGSTGLQALTADDVWTPIDAVAGGFVVNIGDSLAQWTNDRWRSTMHRVVEPPTADRRTSIAFFHNANWDAVIQCLPGLEPALHPPVRAGRHLINKFHRTVI
ncbi:MAG: 2-oxoglutarate and iron-dependent oxygenase domain-containing protein [Ilumatobacteraceae bacterium]